MKKNKTKTSSLKEKYAPFKSYNFYKFHSNITVKLLRRQVFQLLPFINESFIF